MGRVLLKLSSMWSTHVAKGHFTSALWIINMYVIAVHANGQCFGLVESSKATLPKDCPVGKYITDESSGECIAFAEAAVNQFFTLTSKDRIFVADSDDENMVMTWFHQGDLPETVQPNTLPMVHVWAEMFARIDQLKPLYQHNWSPATSTEPSARIVCSTPTGATLQDRLGMEKLVAAWWFSKIVSHNSDDMFQCARCPTPLVNYVILHMAPHEKMTCSPLNPDAFIPILLEALHLQFHQEALQFSMESTGDQRAYKVRVTNLQGKFAHSKKKLNLIELLCSALPEAPLCDIETVLNSNHVRYNERCTFGFRPDQIQALLYNQFPAKDKWKWFSEIEKRSGKLLREAMALCLRYGPQGLRDYVKDV